MVDQKKCAVDLLWGLRMRLLDDAIEARLRERFAVEDQFRLARAGNRVEGGPGGVIEVVFILNAVIEADASFDGEAEPAIGEIQVVENWQRRHHQRHSGRQ